MAVKLLLSPMILVVLLDVVSNMMTPTTQNTSPQAPRSFTIRPIGKVHKSESATTIEIDGKYEHALWGLDEFSHVWVFWWFDRNDTPSKRRTLVVHPRGDARNPLTGVFATRSPARPNLIALTLCEVLAVEQNKIRVADIDAFDGTPVIDVKPYLPQCDRAENVRLPSWIRRSVRD